MATGVQPLSVKQLVVALRDGDPENVAALLHQAVAEASNPWQVLDQVLVPAMHHIGALWERGVISWADEHLATVTCERALTGLYPALLVPAPRSGARILVAAVEGERHRLAPRIIADVLEGQGHEVINLGADVPVEELAVAVRRSAPQLIALSLTLAQATPALERSIAVARSIRPDVLFLLGGQGIGPAWVEAGFPVGDGVESLPDLVSRLLRDRPSIPRTLHTAPPPAVMPVAVGSSAAQP